MADNHYEQTLIQLASKYGIKVSAEQAEQLINHLKLVVEKNKVLNLTRITSIDEAIILHILDSLLMLHSPVIKLKKQSQCLDFGTGAGYPGIVLAIMSKAQWLLDDSVSKKIHAVDEFINKLGLSSHVTTSNKRVEELALSTANYDLVCARAVAELAILLEYTSPLLKDNAYFVAYKARISDEEYDHAQIAAHTCGLDLVSRETFELPHELGHRELFIYQKTGASKIKLPRSIGLAKKNPLYLL